MRGAASPRTPRLSRKDTLHAYRVAANATDLADPFTKMFTSDEHARLRELYMFEQQMPVSAAAA